MRTHRYIGCGRTRRTFYGHVKRGLRVAGDMATLLFGAALLCVGAWEFKE
jgi:hypothetical protein